MSFNIMLFHGHPTAGIMFPIQPQNLNIHSLSGLTYVQYPLEAFFDHSRAQ